MDIGKVTLICVGIYAIVMGIRAVVRKRLYGGQDRRDLDRRGGGDAGRRLQVLLGGSS